MSAKAEVGRGLGQHIGRVGGQHASGIEGGDVQVVVAHRHVGHHAQLRVRGQHSGIDAFAAGGQRAHLAGQAGTQGRWAEDLVIQVGLDLEMLLQPGQGFRVHGPGDQDRGLHAGSHDTNRVKLATGARSVTSWFSGAAMSA